MIKNERVFKNIAGLLVVFLLFLVGTVWFQNFRTQDLTLRVKILKIIKPLPGVHAEATTLVELPDGSRTIMHGDFGNPGDSFTAHVSQFRTQP